MATPRLCKIGGCFKRHYGHGLCNAHYTRWRKHGDPLAGGKTPAEPGEPLRWLRTEIQKDHDDCLIWPFARHQNGYGAVKVGGEQVLTHRWVCEQTKGPPPSETHQAAHSCGNGRGGCVAPSHLRWATPVENMADSIILGRTGRGKRGPHSKLSPSDVLSIRNLQGAETQSEIAARFGVEQTTVGLIHRRETWAWLKS